MDADKSFDLSLDFEGQHYDGVITPSEEKNPDGTPVFFKIMLGDALFAHLYHGDIGWKQQGGIGQPKGLVDAIGDYILEYYE